ncbi:hypothetical protein [Acinetobacter sp. WZC-1]|uniref:hypothetical protein n=1 Tax=Acinetobacter sp. WZC-1 TaxID=3459034 RepID=UPI00403E10B9
MNESQQKQGQTHLLLNAVMIALETFYSFVLKRDHVIDLQARKFVEQQITIKINSYIPLFDFYIQFTDKGMLFDLKEPEQPASLTISSTLLDMIQIFVFGNKRSIRKMRITGDSAIKDELRDLVVHLTVPSLLSDWKKWFVSPVDDQQITASKNRIAPLLEKIDLQRSKLNALQVEVKQYQNRIKRMQVNQQRINIAFGTTAVLFLALILYNLWQLLS